MANIGTFSVDIELERGQRNILAKINRDVAILNNTSAKGTQSQMQKNAMLRREGGLIQRNKKALQSVNRLRDTRKLARSGTTVNQSVLRSSVRLRNRDAILSNDRLRSETLRRDVQRNIHDEGDTQRSAGRRNAQQRRQARMQREAYRLQVRKDKLLKKERDTLKKTGKLTKEKLRDHQASILAIKEQTQELKKQGGLLSRARGGLGRGLGAAGRGAAQAGRGLLSSVGSVAFGGGLAVAAGGVALVDMVNRASDLDEERQKIKDVFSDLSESQIEASVSQLQAQYNSEGERQGGLGLSEFRSKEMIGLLGDIAQGVGIKDQGEALNIATLLAKKAVDVKSFKNVGDLREVALAFAGALTGERERLKTLGYVLRQEDVNERAGQILTENYKREDGSAFTTADFKNLSKELRKSLETKASIDLLFGTYTGREGLTKAADGNFLQYQKTYANTILTLKETILSKKASFGKAFADAITPKLQELNTFINGLDSVKIENWLKNFVEFISTVSKYVFNFITGVGSLFTGGKVSDLNIVKDITGFAKETLTGISETIKEAVEEVRESALDKLDNLNLKSFVTGKGGILSFLGGSRE